MEVTGFGLRVQAICVLSLIFYCVLNSAMIVGVGGTVVLGKGDVTGSKVVYAVVSVVARLCLTLVEETSAG